MVSTPEPLRLFIALWPDAATAQALHAWSDGLHWPPGARRHPAAHLHLTLHFLGATAPDRVPEIAALLPARIEPIELHWGEHQDWGHGLQVLCPLDPPAALFELQQQLGQRLQAHGLPVETRPYRPHLTLARKASGVRAAQELDLRWRATRLVLAQSLRGYHALWSSAD
ncbi:RNA 2',3'-cyclic phosphodiesterase [Inhella proteolytica]|uniref:RNA 2',3'-cyclic phosphodiesterase n=1 Tax=Inhella proteolytica TaxID=2795029 RepID=A0A931J450_9BURK|nr:RNA 2',3'-cyclic phosphodiesterase [Inhella proteolytica]MBH9577423.1 RNA 2',3'-cyclic phosphodiesterase [Inhella proteolytica]